MTRDQTVAQQLVDECVLKSVDLARSPLSNILSSAIGGDEAVPVVSRVDVKERGCVLLLCSDGLTKHVTDLEIETACATVTSAEQSCRDLLQLALERGGSDNITIIVARAPLKQKAGQPD